jgi:integrase
VARKSSDKPWYWQRRKAWYTTIGGKQYNLGPDYDQAEIRRLELKLKHARQPTPPPPARSSVLLVTEVLINFLAWCEKHRDKRTYEFYQDKLQGFVDWMKAQSPSLINLPAADLRPFHLQQWADAPKRHWLSLQKKRHDAGQEHLPPVVIEWEPGQKRQAIMSVQRAFNWAQKAGHMDRSPVAHVEKPPQGKRELIIPFEDHVKMVELAGSEQAQDLLTIAWETGARPQEIMRVEARHVDLAGRRWVFPKKEAKGRKRMRIVYLSDVAFEITKRLMEAHPEGKLLVNTEGNPWNHLSVNCLMLRLAKRTGKKYALVDYRHSFTTRALVKGVDPITLGNLMGHADTTMIARVYSHLNQDSEHLRRALNKANG